MSTAFWTTDKERLQSIDAGLRHRERVLRLLLAKFDTRPATPVCVALCTLDNLGKVNSSSGRAQGDACLKAAWQYVCSGMPAEGFAARWTGDGFLVTFMGAEPELQHFCDHLIARIGFDMPPDLSWSIGAVQLDVPATASTWLAVFEQVDRAMDQAKRRGGNLAVLGAADGAFRVLIGGAPTRLAYSLDQREPD